MASCAFTPASEAERVLEGVGFLRLATSLAHLLSPYRWVWGACVFSALLCFLRVLGRVVCAFGHGPAHSLSCTPCCASGAGAVFSFCFRCGRRNRTTAKIREHKFLGVATRNRFLTFSGLLLPQASSSCPRTPSAKNPKLTENYRPSACSRPSWSRRCRPS